MNRTLTIWLFAFVVFVLSTGPASAGSFAWAPNGSAQINVREELVEYHKYPNMIFGVDSSDELSNQCDPDAYFSTLVARKAIEKGRKPKEYDEAIRTDRKKFAEFCESLRPEDWDDLEERIERVHDRSLRIGWASPEKLGEMPVVAPGMWSMINLGMQESHHIKLVMISVNDGGDYVPAVWTHLGLFGFFPNLAPGPKFIRGFIYDKSAKTKFRFFVIKLGEKRGNAVQQAYAQFFVQDSVLNDGTPDGKPYDVRAMAYADILALCKGLIPYRPELPAPSGPIVQNGGGQASTNDTLNGLAMPSPMLQSGVPMGDNNLIKVTIEPRDGDGISLESLTMEVFVFDGETPRGKFPIEVQGQSELTVPRGTHYGVLCADTAYAVERMAGDVERVLNVGDAKTTIVLRTTTHFVFRKQEVAEPIKLTPGELRRQVNSEPQIKLGEVVAKVETPVQPRIVLGPPVRSVSTKLREPIALGERVTTPAVERIRPTPSPFSQFIVQFVIPEEDERRMRAAGVEIPRAAVGVPTSESGQLVRLEREYKPGTPFKSVKIPAEMADRVKLFIPRSAESMWKTRVQRLPSQGRVVVWLSFVGN